MLAVPEVRMHARAKEIAERIRRAPEVRVYSHIDSDGITGGSIAAEALDRAGIPFKLTFLKKLDTPTVEAIKDEN
ncbi:MAG TPA: recombinase RecJ, partial [Thermoplasmata archaeon]|nr:recombinase RecJ [Thermoplasmata archaeon]